MLLEDPGNALEVYNALNRSAYVDPGVVEACRLEQGISLSVRNDASFILDMSLNIYEHESTVCPNMPLRALIYVTNILEQWVRDRNIYGRRLVKIPTPRFAVFYNGTEEQPGQYELKLSDAFASPIGEPELELTCTVYNINPGKNQGLLSECRVLREFLIEHRGEVTKVTQLDYTFDRRLALEREEVREEVRAEERANTERERQRADLAEAEVRRLQAELESYKSNAKPK